MEDQKDERIFRNLPGNANFRRLWFETRWPEMWRFNAFRSTSEKAGREDWDRGTGDWFDREKHFRYPFFFAEPVFALYERKVSFRDRMDSSFHLKQAEKLTSRTARRRLLNGGRGFLGMGGGIICQSKKEQRIQRSWMKELIEDGSN